MYLLVFLGGGGRRICCYYYGYYYCYYYCYYTIILSDCERLCHRSNLDCLILKHCWSKVVRHVTLAAS